MDDCGTYHAACSYTTEPPIPPDDPLFSAFIVFLVAFGAIFLFIL